MVAHGGESPTRKANACRHVAHAAVTSNPKRRHDRQQTNRKTTDKMPTLRKIKRAATQRTSRHKLQHILFCPNAPKPTHHPTSGRLII